MSMQLEVYALSEHLCTVKCERDWTGRQLKEAIEEATSYKELVGSQQLAMGTTFLSDSDVLGDLDSSQGVSLTRRPCPRVRQLPEGDLKPIASSLRLFQKSPVLVWPITRGYLCNGNPEAWNDTEAVLRKIRGDLEGERDSDDEASEELPQRLLDIEMMDDLVPWNALAGISPHDIAAVLALQACYMWVGDGSSTVAALLLMKDNTFVAFFAKISEACHACDYGDATLTSVESAKTWEELKSKFPSEFLDALVKPISDWPFGHHRITSDDVKKVHPPFRPCSSLRLAVLQLLKLQEDDHNPWTCGSALDKWKMDPVRRSSFEGLWFCPTRSLCFRIRQHGLMMALESCSQMTSEWRKAAGDAQTEMTQYGASFPEAVEFFRSRLADGLESNSLYTSARTEPDLQIFREVERRFNQKIHELLQEIDDFVQSGQELDQPIDTWLGTMVRDGREVDGAWQEPEMRLFVELVLDSQFIVYADSWLKNFISKDSEADKPPQR